MLTGADVRKWREARGMSQAQLSECLPVAIKTLQGWEQGRGTPPPYIERALNDLARELSLGTRGAKPDIVIHSDVQSPPLRGVSVDLSAIDRTAPPVFDDIEDEDAQPHELAYVTGDDPA